MLEILTDHGVDVNATDKNGDTALVTACTKGNMDNITVLLKAGADPNMANAHGTTCLHCAVFQGYSIDVLQILTDHGAVVNTLNKNGDTALLLASCKGNIDNITVGYC